MSDETKMKFKENWEDFKTQGKECIKEFLNKETRKQQIPNMFTASRLLAPFVIIPSALCGNIPLTVLFSGLFALTDAADGYFARKYNATSEFGRKLDPITDKVFAGSLLIPLMIINPLTIINFIGEAIIALINTRSQFSEHTPHTVIAGKIKTGALYLTIALSYTSFVLGISPSIIDSFIGLTALLQGVTAFEYYQKFKNNEKLKQMNHEENLYQQAKIEEEQKEIDKNISKELTREEKITELKELQKEILGIDKVLEEQTNNKQYIIKK